MNVVALICARGGSKGLPGKKIRPLAGKPLIAWAIEQALEVERVDRGIVSTDSSEIAAVAKQYGAEVPFMRPPELAEDIVIWCLDQMAYYKAPGHIAFVDALPLTATQKIQRAALKDLAVQLHGQGQAHDTVHLKKRQTS